MSIWLILADRLETIRRLREHDDEPQLVFDKYDQATVA